MSRIQETAYSRAIDNGFAYGLDGADPSGHWSYEDDLKEEMAQLIDREIDFLLISRGLGETALSITLLDEESLDAKVRLDEANEAVRRADIKQDSDLLRALDENKVMHEYYKKQGYFNFTNIAKDEWASRGSFSTREAVKILPEELQKKPIIEVCRATNEAGCAMEAIKIANATQLGSQPAEEFYLATAEMARDVLKIGFISEDEVLRNILQSYGKTLISVFRQNTRYAPNIPKLQEFWPEVVDYMVGPDYDLIGEDGQVMADTVYGLIRQVSKLTVPFVQLDNPKQRVLFDHPKEDALLMKLRSKKI